MKKWLHWAQRSQLHPIKELAKTIKQQRAGTVNAFEAAHLHTGYVEAVNSLLQAAKAKACGYGTTRHFIAVIYRPDCRLADSLAWQPAPKSKPNTLGGQWRFTRNRRDPALGL